jgi:hypothetical protein
MSSHWVVVNSAVTRYMVVTDKTKSVAVRVNSFAI